MAAATKAIDLEALMASPKFHSTFVDGLLQQGEVKSKIEDLIKVIKARGLELTKAQRHLWVRFGSLVADPDTWRSLLWSTVDILAGWLLTLAPAGLIARGLFGLVMPAVWHPIVNAHGNNWYAFIHVTTASTAWLSVALGIAFIALGLLTAPRLLRRYAALARSLQTPA